MISLIDADHFSGQRNIMPTPEVNVRDLADILRELQGDVNKVAPTYVAIDDNDTPYSPATGVNLIGVDTTTAVVTVVLPDPATVEVGAPIVIKDEGGNAGANAITVQGTVDGSADPTISTNYDKLEVYSNGTAWMTK